MKILFSCILVILSFNFNDDPRERFSYQEHAQLTWQDFKGVPPQGAHHFASVNCGMGYSFSSKKINGNIKVNVEVTSYFYPQLSWKKNLDEDNMLLLAHEQLHWDISELYARKLREAFTKYVPQKNVKKEIDFIFQKFEEERQRVQSTYDKETNHGLLKEMQATWSLKIKEELFMTSTSS